MRPPAPEPSHGGFSTEQQAREAIVETMRSLSQHDLNRGKSGNASLRWHRGAADGLLLTPSGLAYERMTADDLVWVPLEQPDPVPEAEDELLPPPARFDGAYLPSSEWRIHLDLHRRRPDARAVLHLHSPWATTLACLPRVQSEGIPAFHYMVAVAGGNDLRCAAYARFGSAKLSELTLGALDGRRACLMAHHGMIAIGADLRPCLDLAIEVEVLCRLYGQALSIGEPGRLDDAEMAQVLAQFAVYGRAQAARKTPAR